MIIEQIDIYGRCSLYASHVIANPGPLDDKSLVVRNEDRSRDRRSVVLKLTKIIKKVGYQRVELSRCGTGSMYPQRECFGDLVGMCV